jgi:hypothetical protein
MAGGGILSNQEIQIISGIIENAGYIINDINARLYNRETQTLHNNVNKQEILIKLQQASSLLDPNNNTQLSQISSQAGGRSRKNGHAQKGKHTKSMRLKSNSKSKSKTKNNKTRRSR